MDTASSTQALFSFLAECPNSYFAVQQMARRLDDAGFTPLSEGDHWSLSPGDRCYVTRNGSSIIAFSLPRRNGARHAFPFAGFQILATHCDSPTFRIKPNAELVIENRYVRLNIEKYGGMLCSTWFDRPLSVAGRLLVRTADSGIRPVLVRLDRDLLVIPSLCIHFDRGANEGRAINVQRDMLPLFSAAPDVKLMDVVAAQAGVSPEDVVDCDLFLYNRMPGTVFGARNEFIAAGRLDDMQCAFASLQGFLSSEPGASCAVHCVFDNEEVGSLSKQGAASTFLRDVLRRICLSMDLTEEDYLRLLARSYMVSADNAQALHPNFSDKSDPGHRPLLNGGIVLKYAANQKYATDGLSGALFRMLCDRCGIPYQLFANRSDIPGGSTLGNLSSAQVPVLTADVGLPQLAMHSSWETAGAEDTQSLISAAQELFSTSLYCDENGAFSFQTNF